MLILRPCSPIQGTYDLIRKRDRLSVNGQDAVKALHDLTIVNDIQHYTRLNRARTFAPGAERRFLGRML